MTDTTRRAYAGGAKAGALTAPINTTVLDVACDALVGWPDGSGGKEFAAVIGRGLPNEEKVLCHARTGANLTLTSRGYDGTSPASHSATETIEHCHTAKDDDEANEHSSNPFGHGIPNDDRIVGKDKVQTLTHKTMDGDPDVGANTFTNIPASAIPSLASLPGDVAALAGDVSDLATDLDNNYYTKAESEGTDTDHGVPFINRTQGDSRYLRQAAAPNNFLTQGQSDARYLPLWTFGAWVTETSIGTGTQCTALQPNWQFDSVKYRKIQSGKLEIWEWILAVTRITTALLNTASGNVTETILTMGRNFVLLGQTYTNRPDTDTPMTGPVTTGRLGIAEWQASDGQVILQAVGGTSDVAVGEHFTLRCLVMRQDVPV